MNAAKILESAMRACVAMRRGGTTSALGVLMNQKDPQPVLVSATADIARAKPGPSGCSLALSEAGDRLEGVRPRPLLFDTDAVLELCRVAADEINGQERLNTRLQQEVTDRTRANVALQSKLTKAERAAQEHEQQLLWWMAENVDGMSARAIAVHNVNSPGAQARSRYHYPSDASDFGRCYRMLKICPAMAIWKMRGVSPVWDRLVDAWPELTRLYLQIQVGIMGRTPASDAFQEVLNAAKYVAAHHLLSGATGPVADESDVLDRELGLRWFRVDEKLPEGDETVMTRVHAGAPKVAGYYRKETQTWYATTGQKLAGITEWRYLAGK